MSRNKDVLLQRCQDTRVFTNVAHRITQGTQGTLDHFSFDWGLNNQQSYELAMNILFAVGMRELSAKRMGPSFSEEMLSSIPFTGGRIPFEDIKNWVDDNSLDDDSSIKI